MDQVTCECCGRTLHRLDVEVVSEVCRTCRDLCTYRICQIRLSWAAEVRRVVPHAPTD